MAKAKEVTEAVDTSAERLVLQSQGLLRHKEMEPGYGKERCQEGQDYRGRIRGNHRS